MCYKDEVQRRNTEKLKYIVENCKYLHDKDLDFIVRVITIMREEYVKINTEIEWYFYHSFYII